MRIMGLAAIYRRPNTSKPHPEHRVYPYLLRGMTIDAPNQVWCADVSYLPMRRGFLYLVAIMDWASRKVLSWRLSNTMDADFCVAALEDALARYGRPEIFNADQGSQFTSFAFINALKGANIRISMDGKGRWMDNVMIERLWRSLKYECVYLNAYETGSELREELSRWISFYNERRPHSSLDDKTHLRHTGKNPGPASQPSTVQRLNPYGFPPYLRRQPVKQPGPPLIYNITCDRGDKHRYPRIRLNKERFPSSFYPRDCLSSNGCRLSVPQESVRAIIISHERQAFSAKWMTMVPMRSDTNIATVLLVKHQTGSIN